MYMSNQSDSSLLTVSSDLNIAHRSNNKQRTNKISREPSPIPNALDLQRPNILSEYKDLNRSCDKLSTLLGQQKSFSTSNIASKRLGKNISLNGRGIVAVRHAVSELALNSIQRYGYMLDSARLSRSCSTWVAVGELASTSQLPSPHGHCSNLTMTSSQQQLSASNLFGQVRERTFMFRNRLLTTHRAIERLSQSEFNLDQLATTIIVSEGSGPGPVELIIPEPTNAQFEVNAIQLSSTASPCTQKAKYRSKNMSQNLTIQDIEKERGRPLSKYDRNFMIFNWLHSLDESSVVEDSNQ